MFFSFFKKAAGKIRQMPVKKRVVTAAVVGLGTATLVAGTGPVAAYASRTSSGGAGTASVGTSCTPGGKAYGSIAPGYFAVTPLATEYTIGSAGTSNADYTLLVDSAETSSAVMIPDQNEASLLFVPKMTWNNETGLKGNNSNWWLRDGSKNYGRDCARYKTWLIRMNQGDKISSSQNASISDNYIYASGTKTECTSWKQFNNIVFCELSETMLNKRDSGKNREIGSAEVGDIKDLKIMDEGVYRKRVYNYIKNKDGSISANQYGYYDFSQLSGMDDKEFTTFLQYVVYGETQDDGSIKRQTVNYKHLNKTLVKNSQKLWNAFTQITVKDGKYVTHVDRINDFLNDSYNYAITKSPVSGYFSGKKLSDGSPLTLTVGGKLKTIGAVALGQRFNHTNDDSEWLSELGGKRSTYSGLNKEDDGKCRVYCSNMYRLGFLDLLLTAYTISANQHE